MRIEWDSFTAAAAAGMLLFFLLLGLWSRSRQGSGWRFSGFWLAAPSPTLRGRLAKAPFFFGVLAFLFFLLAYPDFHTFAERHNPEDKKPPPLEGAALYLVLDISGSMNAKVEGSDKRKIALVKEVSKKFVLGDKEQQLPGRPNDLVGIVTFSRGADILSPLTLDHRQIGKKLDALDVNRNPDQMGTEIGYAIYKTASLIAETRQYSQTLAEKEGGLPAYEIKSAAIVLVTDGFQEIHPDDEKNPRRSIDLFAAAEYARAHNVKLYIINIDPRMGESQYTSYRELFEIVTKVTGGAFFSVSDAKGLEAVYKKIDALEVSKLPEAAIQNKELLPQLYDKVSLNNLFIALGMAALLLSCLLETTWLRRVR